MHTTFQSEILNRKDDLGDLDVDGKIVSRFKTKVAVYAYV
jgi:hypothetical protein